MAWGKRVWFRTGWVWAPGMRRRFGTAGVGIFMPSWPPTAVGASFPIKQNAPTAVGGYTVRAIQARCEIFAAGSSPPFQKELKPKADTMRNQTPLLLMLASLALADAPALAQAVYTPYTFTTLAGKGGLRQ